MNEVILFCVCFGADLLWDMTSLFIVDNALYELWFANPMYICIPVIMFLYCRSCVQGIVRMNRIILLFWSNYIIGICITVAFFFLFRARFINWNFFRSNITWLLYFFLIALQNYISINMLLCKRKSFLFFILIMVIMLCIAVLVTLLKFKLVSGDFFPIFAFGEFVEMLKIGMIPDVIVFYEGFLFYYFSKHSYIIRRTFYDSKL